MATYSQEKFEEINNGDERKVCWRRDKHVHDTKTITAIEKWLGEENGGTWKVRTNSYQSGLQRCAPGTVYYDQ